MQLNKVLITFRPVTKISNNSLNVLSDMRNVLSLRHSDVRQRRPEESQSTRIIRRFRTHLGLVAFPVARIIYRWRVNSQKQKTCLRDGSV
jgi:hypothetical protein